MKLKDPSLFRQQCYIDGKWVQAASGKTIVVRNPATGAIVCRSTLTNPTNGCVP